MHRASQQGPWSGLPSAWSQWAGRRPSPSSRRQSGTSHTRSHGFLPTGMLGRTLHSQRGTNHTILYLDNFDEIRYLSKEIAEEQQGRPSENHVRLISACNMLGLPRSWGKQLSGGLAGTLQGGVLQGRENRVPDEKTVELLELSLGSSLRRSSTSSAGRERPLSELLSAAVLRAARSLRGHGLGP